MSARDREPLQPHTLADWRAGVAALGCDLKHGSGEWTGPCPVCGGVDRFHVKPGKRAKVLAHCRHGCRFEDLARAVFGLGNGNGLPPRGPAPGIREARPSSSPASEEREAREAVQLAADALALAGALWRQGIDPEGTPAATYLRDRMAWPPEGEGFPPIPAAVRWLPRDTMDRARIRKGAGKLPEDAAGAIGYRLATADAGESPETKAVQLEALQADGAQCSPRWRKGVGTKTGAVFAVPAVVGDGAPGVRIVEGEVTALAAALLNPTEAVRGTGGTTGFAVAALDGVSADTRVTIEGDGDPAGRRAGMALERDLRAAGWTVELRVREAAVSKFTGALGETDAADDLECLAAEGLALTGDLVAGWRRVLTWIPEAGP